jgi:sirohydrochlorin ferrochelatase
MDGLILFSHGSLLCGAGETLNEHAERLRRRTEFAAVEVGYMNYSEPSFEEAVARCAEAGVTRVVVVPYFLVPGKFVRFDLPKRIEAAQAAWPGITFTVADAIGYHEELADAILDMASHARSSDAWREDYQRASAFCEADPHCPLYGTPQCPRVPSPALATSP